jgi:hypothetical protein
LLFLESLEARHVLTGLGLGESLNILDSVLDPVLDPVVEVVDDFASGSDGDGSQDPPSADDPDVDVDAGLDLGLGSVDLDIDLDLHDPSLGIDLDVNLGGDDEEGDGGLGLDVDLGIDTDDGLTGNIGGGLSDVDVDLGLEVDLENPLDPNLGLDVDVDLPGETDANLETDVGLDLDPNEPLGVDLGINTEVNLPGDLGVNFDTGLGVSTDPDNLLTTDVDAGVSLGELGSVDTKLSTDLNLSDGLGNLLTANVGVSASVLSLVDVDLETSLQLDLTDGLANLLTVNIQADAQVGSLINVNLDADVSAGLNPGGLVGVSLTPQVNILDLVNIDADVDVGVNLTGPLVTVGADVAINDLVIDLGNIDLGIAQVEFSSNDPVNNPTTPGGMDTGVDDKGPDTPLGGNTNSGPGNPFLATGPGEQTPLPPVISNVVFAFSSVGNSAQNQFNSALATLTALVDAGFGLGRGTSAEIDDATELVAEDEKVDALLVLDGLADGESLEDGGEAALDKDADWDVLMGRIMNWQFGLPDVLLDADTLTALAADFLEQWNAIHFGEPTIDEMLASDPSYEGSESFLNSNWPLLGLAAAGLSAVVASQIARRALRKKGHDLDMDPMFAMSMNPADTDV